MVFGTQQCVCTIGHLPLRRQDNAIEIGLSIDDPLLVAEALRERGELHRQRGLFDEALADWSMAREGFDSIHADADAVEIGVLVAQLTEHSLGGEQPQT